MREINRAHVEAHKRHIREYRYDLRERLVRVRNEKGIPLGDVAEYLGLPVDMLYWWEDGGESLDHDLLVGYAIYVGVDVTYHLEEYDEG